MIPVFICDDEQIWIKSLKTAVEKYIMKSDWGIEIAKTALSPQELLDYVKDNSIQHGIYFLDINFPEEMNGLTLGTEIRKLDKNSTFIFVTTREDMAKETFRLKLQALEYIEKDYFSHIEERVISCLQHLEERYTQEPQAEKRMLLIEEDDILQNIPFDNILYVETVPRQRKSVLHLTNGMITANVPLITIRQKLDDQFLPGNRNFVFNLKHLQSINLLTKTISLSNNITLNCSFRELEHVKHRMHTLYDR